jgi:hypothetical protein
MSCGSCSKWQHIPCHDAADRKSGRPPRNWEVEEFICSDCNSRVGAGLPAQRSDQYSQGNYAQTKVQLRWDHGRSSPKLPVGRQVTDPTIIRVRPELPSPMNGYSQPVNNEQYVRASPPAASNSYSNITFSHYHPQRRGFSSSPGLLAQQHQPQLSQIQTHPLPHSSSSIPPHNPPIIYSPHNNALATPQMQAYGTSSGFNDGYQPPVIAASVQVNYHSTFTRPMYSSCAIECNFRLIVGRTSRIYQCIRDNLASYTGVQHGARSQSVSTTTVYFASVGIRPNWSNNTSSPNKSSKIKRSGHIPRLLNIELPRADVLYIQCVCHLVYLFSHVCYCTSFCLSDVQDVCVCVHIVYITGLIHGCGVNMRSCVFLANLFVHLEGRTRPGKRVITTI